MNMFHEPKQFNLHPYFLNNFIATVFNAYIQAQCPYIKLSPRTFCVKVIYCRLVNYEYWINVYWHQWYTARMVYNYKAVSGNRNECVSYCLGDVMNDIVSKLYTVGKGCNVL
jgi:hypothetical protein